MKVLLANPRGFCAGVDRAIDIVERALSLFGAPIYVRHEVVHNRFVVEDLRARGARFVEEIADIPDGATVIFSAHGVSKEVREQAHQRGLQVFDATCPLVTKVHMEVARHARAGREVVLIGHAGHPEVQGSMGQYLPVHVGAGIYLVETADDVAKLKINNPQQLAFVTQTTLSLDDTRAITDALRARFPAVIGPKHDDICYATQNRQDAVQALSARCDLILVVGSPTSSNSNRLVEVAEKRGVPAYLVDGADDIRHEWLYAKECIGVTAGASAPEVLVDGVLERLKQWGADTIEEQSGRREHMVFALPRNLRL